MSNADCATTLRRGYLTDKKAGLLDPKKKWFVLRQDYALGYCVLEYFKDEKSWTKREPPKGFINVREIVQVQRLPDKKQSFELLCPGMGYRLMANSEAEADDWATAIQKLIVYRKDFRSLSLPRISQGGGSSPLSSSPPSFPVTTTSIPGPVPHALPVPPMFSIDGSNFHSHSPNHTALPHHQFPTPPETFIGTTNPLVTPPLQKQGSNEGVAPYPSPPSSNDSASMCGSSTSFDSGPLAEGFEPDLQKPSRFRVTVNDSERLNVFGECDLVISEDSLTLLNPTTGSQFATWPLGAVKRYGVNSVCFTFDSGRYCGTGEGTFFFYSHQSRLIHTRVHMAIQRMNSKGEPRRASAPDTCTSATRTAMPLPPLTPISRVPSKDGGDFLSSPPQYNHIEHHLKHSNSHDMYTKLKQTSPSAFSTCSSFSTFNHLEYEKLNHDSHPLHSQTAPVISAKQINYSSLVHNPPEHFYSTLKEVEAENQETKRSEDDETATPVDGDCPPPIPPRLSKMTSI